MKKSFNFFSMTCIFDMNDTYFYKVFSSIKMLVHFMGGKDTINLNTKHINLAILPIIPLLSPTWLQYTWHVTLNCTDIQA